MENDLLSFHGKWVSAITTKFGKYGPVRFCGSGTDCDVTRRYFGLSDSRRADSQEFEHCMSLSMRLTRQ